MKKIAFIGAGSVVFTRTLVRDILSFPALADVEIALMDINETRLNLAKQTAEKIVKMGNYPAKVTATMDRIKALEGADGVVVTILAGGVHVWRHDIEIPKKYGVDINVGDTRGPSGIFRFLRSAPVTMEIARDIEKYAPNALVLNYTNPMAMLCRMLQGETKLNVTGLCHSVQGTAEMLARWIGAPINNVSYLCAGINHLAFYLEYKVDGVDAYPRIKAAVERPEIYNEEIVRNEMYLHLDYYVTESSGHNSEYNPWFRKRPDLIEKYCTHGTGWNPGVYAYIRDEYLKQETEWKTEVEGWLTTGKLDDMPRSHEYASHIFNACFGDGAIFQFNGNVRNYGIIPNLPEGCCVEVPMYASKDGLKPVVVGNLPQHLAVMVHQAALCEELAIEGYLTGDRRKIFHAVLNDPLTAAVCSMAEIKSMVDEMFVQNADYLKGIFD